MSALVRITTGIMPQHSRVGFSRAMAQFGEVVHCHKPPYSGMPGEDFVNVRFSSQDGADRAHAALKADQVFVDGFQVGVGGPAIQPKGFNNELGKGGKGGGKGRRSPSPPRRYGRNLRQRSPPRGVGSGGGGGRRRSPSHEKSLSIRDRGGSRSPRRREEPRRGPDGGFGGQTGMIRNKSPARDASPDPPGPLKSIDPVRNPFYKRQRSRSQENDMPRNNHQIYDEA